VAAAAICVFWVFDGGPAGVLDHRAMSRPGVVIPQYAPNLVRARRDAGLSRDELARAVPCGVWAVIKWEQARGMPRTVTLIRLAEILGQDIAWFFVDHEGAERAA